MKKICIAIDGPASSGKSTIAKILAKEFSFIYTDTGAMYRTVTYLALQHHVELTDGQGLAELISRYPITFKQGAKGQLVFAGTEDVTSAIRQPDVTNAVSIVAAEALVRQQLVKAQQEIAKEGGVVMDGRDIGTTVLPAAEVKIFLVASVKERAERRYKENKSKGIETDFDTLKNEIEHRDYLDSHREISPLTQADDAILFDTTGKDIPQVVAEVKALIQKQGYVI